MAMDTPEEEKCEERALVEELRKLLEQADAQWRAVEDRLDEVQEETLKEHAQELENRFGIETAELYNLSEGGLGWKVRGRVHRVLLGPVAERMRQQVRPAKRPTEADAEEARETISLVLDDLLDRWDLEVEPLLVKVGQQDARMARRARRKMKIGATREAWQVESQQRPAVWAPARGVLEGIAGDIRRLSDFLELEVSPDSVDHLAASVPAVIARAVCDWHFRGPLAELEQLENWWEGAREALQGQADLWERLVQEEGVFLRRINRGVDALRSARQLYETYADFGTGVAVNGAWPSHLMNLLAEAASEMISRLRPVRDSAAWRVVDAAKSIQKQLREAKQQSSRQGIWQGVSEQEGLLLLVKALAGPEQSSGSAEDQTMVFMGRVDRLTAFIGDLREVVGQELRPVLDDVLQAAAAISEDLLELLDEPSEDGLESCVQQWRQLGEAFDAISRLETALKVAALVSKGGKLAAQGAEQNSRQNLAMLRGLKAFLASAELRDQLTWSCSEDAISRSACSEQVQGLNAFSEPPKAAKRREGSGSPRAGYAGGYAPRRAARFEEATPSPAQSPEVTAREPVSPKPDVPKLSLPNESQDFELSKPTLQSRPGTGVSNLRPGTPSWLKPPWQRPDTPSAASWTRPDTPSTVCDDAEVAALPRWKCVDGQYVPLKSIAVSARLPPLMLGQQAQPLGALRRGLGAGYS
mmetsp:Transcript_50846/g.91396  ORF Transcript_50846/g.91396 Transcript_50846/m.91396 type:complete len:699 (-) Transcript_50846:151-2247(-)|eukprot:CAMPEP_0197654760 /NCGR_PEP_ID=MMETSP1338-20131121/39038_1 /TAXON_ID=43686 ORGANISM="Pelagodinium beii, Strain RCC1491" /NCGR_SAMPLE_ID=MMETSP1338 /ASSEMBLY_ACC=CAM_ASM_000754 /LENGTH=698 /DNA_ID=CAMNT_0043230263 /DNA_START=58 /DNA_END=2154 /DNA_ORIENTATION=-